jgi:hypothetical protein
MEPPNANEGALGVERSIALTVAARDVWSLIGDFAGLDRWMPGILAIDAVGQGVGAVRTVRAKAGSFEERLEASGPMWMRYTMLTGPLPAQNYCATLSVAETSDASCRVDWRSRFDAGVGVSPRTAVAAVEAVYAAGLKALARRFAT